MAKRASDGGGLTRREALRTGAGAFSRATAILTAGGDWRALRRKGRQTMFSLHPSRDRSPISMPRPGAGN